VIGDLRLAIADLRLLIGHCSFPIVDLRWLTADSEFRVSPPSAYNRQLQITGRKSPIVNRQSQIANLQ
jgi:hypothetical protein